MMRMNRTMLLVLALLGALSAMLAPMNAKAAWGDSGRLAKSFATPPPEARPWVYWFWSAGNITREGITADLEAMARVGIGGVLIMEVDQGVPQGPVVYLSPQWRELYKHMIAEAGRLGIVVDMNNDGGWCGSGGPWIKPEQSMQIITWSETNLKGPRKFEGVLGQGLTNENFYEDIAVLAFPAPAAEQAPMTDCAPKVTIGQKSAGLDPAVLIDGNLGTNLVLPFTGKDNPQYVQFEFAKPFQARSLSLALKTYDGWWIPYHGLLQVSDDGKQYKTVREFDFSYPVGTFDFDKVSGRFYRVLFPGTPQPGNALASNVLLSEITLNPSTRIEGISRKGGYIANTYAATPVGMSVPPEATVDPAKILDLSAKMDKHGRLNWDVPAGAWTVLRLGHTTTGKKNHPAPPASLGLECDKMSKAAIESHFNGLMGQLLKLSDGKALKYTHIDSWEVGSGNWSPTFREEFKKRCGYDPVPLLPILTGRAIGSQEASDRFLWDLRRTVADLVAENYAGRMAELSNQHGIKLSIEAYGDGVFDTLAYGGRADMPMGEFWRSGGCVYLSRAMASAGHVYGKPVIGAESFTSEAGLAKWQNHPFSLKAQGDGMFCEGINQFVFHRYSHQPWLDVKPGMTMGPWGLHYERTNTWWELSKPWHEYLARCQYLLQQGQFIADVAYLLGEQAPNDPPKREDLKPALPAGYDFDLINGEAVRERMSVKDGRLAVEGGMSYRVLVLPQSETMTPALLRKIEALVKGGATVVGPKPLTSPSLVDYPRCDAEIKRLADELWGDCDGQKILEHRYGKGRVIWGRPLDQILAGMQAPPDFSAVKELGSSPLRTIHRNVGGTEVYFISNPNSSVEEALCTFRVADRRPELWWPDSGRIEPAAVYDAQGATMRLPLRLDPCGSVFVVFPRGAKPAPTRVTGVALGGKTLLSAGLPAGAGQGGDNNQSIAGTFTMTLWAKPSAETLLPAEASYGVSGMDGANNAIYPAPGHEVYTQAGQACAGVAVGRNGVCVSEHGVNHYAPVLVDKTPIEGWTHVAVVYKDGKPSLYLNGKLVHEGVKSAMTVHPALGVKHSRPVSPFKGMLTAPRQFGRALGEAELAELMRADAPGAGEVTLAADAKGATLQAWQAGTYELTRANGRVATVQVPALPAPIQVEGPWDVHFAKGWGAPEQISFDKLISWPTHPDKGIKYFSGTAAYHKQLDVPAESLKKDQRLYLDLGDVQVIADVKLNGKDLGIFWKPPFHVDLTGVAKAGENALEIDVTNLWPNRLIGDEQLPDDCEWITPQDQGYGALKAWPKWFTDKTPRTSGRRTFATWKHYVKDSPLLESGLLGPVTLRTAQTVRVKP